MLVRLVELRSFVNQLWFDHNGEALLTPQEWSEIEAAVQVLQPWFEMTTVLEGERISTLSIAMPVACHTMKTMQALTNLPSGAEYAPRCFCPRDSFFSG